MMQTDLPHRLRPAPTHSPGADPGAVIAFVTAQGGSLRLAGNAGSSAPSIAFRSGIVALIGSDHEPDEVAALVIDLRRWIGSHSNVHGLRWALRKAQMAEVSR